MQRRGSFKKLTRYSAALTVVAGLAVLNISLLHQAHAVYTYNASDNLGQTMTDHTTPRYDTTGPNNAAPANHIGLNGNKGLALDTVNHRLFVADSENSRVLVYNLDVSNHFTSQSANFAIGQAGFATDILDHTSSCVYFGQFGNPMPSQDQLCIPDSVAYDSVHNRLFVGDKGWDRVLVFDLTGGISNNMSASYVLGQPDFVSATAAANCNSPTQNRLCFTNGGGGSSGLAYDSANQRLFVAEAWQSRVLVFNVNTGTIANGENASNVLGQPDFTSNSGNVTQDGLNTAEAVAYDSINQRLFVGDSQRVMVYSLSGGVTDGMNAANVLGQPDFTTNGCYQPPTQSSICSAEGLFYDTGSSRLFVGDQNGSRVLIFNLSGGITDGMNAANELGQANFTSAVYATTQSSLSGPSGVVYDPASQQLLVSDGDPRLMTYDLSGAITNGMNASHEQGQTDYSGNPSYSLRAPDNSNPGPYGYYDGVDGMAEDKVHHRLYVTDYDNGRVLIYNLDANNHLTSHAADYVLGQSNFSSVGTTVCATQSAICEPIALAADAVHDRLFVADWTKSRVMVYNLSGGITNGMNASYELGQINFTTVGEHCNGLTGQNNLCDPAGLAYDSNNDRLYVSEEGNSRIMVFNVNPATIANGENASNVLGQPNFTASVCDNGGVSAHALCSPEGLTYDATDNWLFVSEDDNSRVLQFDMSGGVSNNMNASHVIGQPNFTSFAFHCGNITSAAGFCDPFGSVAYDPATKRLFVPDTSQNRILEFNLSGGITNGMSASYSIGLSDSQDLTHRGGGCNNESNQFSLCRVEDLVYDKTAGKLYAADTYDNRVMVFDIGVKITTTSLPNGPKGQPYSQTVAISDSGGAPGFSISAGSLPPGLGINSGTGVISGTPSASGSYSFTVQVNDSGETDSHAYTIYIGVQITTTSLPDGTKDNPYSQTIQITDASGTPGFSISAGSLPPGLGINSGTGVISGTPTSTGNYSFTVQVTDAAGATDSQAYSMQVAQAYSASDEYGQVNGSDQPVWIQNGNYNNTGSANNNGFGYPTGTAIDTVHHRLFVADDDFYRVLVFNLDNNNNLIDHTADNVIGQPDFTSSNSNCGTGTATQNSGCYQYVGIAYNSVTNQLFVSDSGNNRVLVYNLSGGISNGMNASYVLGQPNFTTVNFTTDQQTTSFPEGLAVDSVNNRLFVADDGNTRVLVYNLSGGISNGMNASFVLGQPDFTSSSSDTTQNTLSTPEDMVFNSNTQQLFVADSFNDRVLIFNAAPGGISNGMNASFVLGQPDFTTFAFGNTSQNSFYEYIEGLAVDPATNRLFVADEGNNRVMIFNLSGGITNGMNASGVLGQSTFTASDYGVSQNAIDDPEGAMSYDPANKRLYVTDSSNSRIMVYDFAALSFPAPGGSMGTPYSFSTSGHTQGTPAFSITSGSLPTGLSLNASSGLISGTPSALGTFNFTIHLSDNNNAAGIFVDDYSYSVTITNPPPDNMPPSVPANLHVTGTSTTTVSLAWNSSTDNVGVTGYHVFRDGVQVGVPGGTTFTDSGLSVSTTYHYTVSAFDAATNESVRSSPSVPATTDNNGGGGGNNNGGNNNNNGGNNNSGNGGNGGGHSSSSNSSANPVPAPLDLDNLPGFSDGSGFTTDISAGQILTFTDTSNGSHSITVPQIDTGDIQLKLDSTDLSLKPGNKTSRDVNNDGHNDIEIDLNKIDSGKANMTFKKIIYAIAPGGQTSSGFGAGSGSPASQVKASPGLLSRLLHRVPKVIWLAFPWLLFILLASSVARLSYLSYQERKLAGRLIEQLNQEKALAQEKNNFVTLSSHYLRTPMSTIANGLELVSSLGKGNQTAAELVTIGSQLNTGVNDLLSKAAARAPSEVQAAPGVISPLGAAKSMAAGFIRISSLQVMLFALTASFVLVGIADYILKHVDLYNVGLVNYLTQLAGLILVAILFYASLRSYHKRKQLREQAEVLLNQQRELDNGRNLLVRNSLNNLNGPLKELKIKLQTGAGLNPQALRPVLAGIAQLDSLFQKFVILTSLESGAMIKANQMVELNQLAGQSIQRYGNALQAKGLSVKNEVQSSNLSQDPLLLTFVIDSLLSNAIKYSPQGGEITINSRQRHDWVELFVKDSGPGIDEAKQAQLFQPFSRAENAAEDFNRQGVGLSLYLDRLVMSYLGGNLEINSKPGAGTTMRVGIAA